MVDHSKAFYIADPDVSTRLVHGQGAVLYHPDSGREKFINFTGSYIWKLLDGTKSRNDIAGVLVDAFEDLPWDQIDGDLTAFLNDLEAEGFARACRYRIDSAPLAYDFADMADAPQSIDLALTGKCNLNCVYCFYNDEMQTRKDLPIGQWLTFFNELKRLGVRSATLSGGEIFVRPDLWEIIDALVDSRLRYGLLSNGTLITDKTLHEFETGRRFNRLNSLQVSIDGSCADVHDKSRGKGCFEKVVRGLRMLKEAGFPVTVRVTVNRYNVDDLDNIAQLLLDDIGLPSIGTNDVIPMGSGCDNQKTVILTPQQQVRAMKTLARLAQQYDGRITATAGPLAKWRIYQEMEHARATKQMAKQWKMGYLTACGCTYNKLSVHHDGTITPCNMLAKLVLGRINQDSLADLWKKHPALQALKDRRKIPMSQVPGCENCEWAPFCNGSCPGLAHEMTGDVNLANPHDCYLRFLKETAGIDFNLDSI